ncbi:MAG: RsbRD N-terminal domain-containing protein [Desulfobacterales bacterium]
MGLKTLLEKNRSAILKKWFNAFASTYALDTSQFLKSQNDRFANPVGITVSEGLNSLFSQLVTEPDADRMREYLDPMIRIRAIQDFTPSQATSFILSLKSIIRDTLKKQLEKSDSEKKLPELDMKIDRLLLLAFDIYMECREKIYDLKANEEKNKVFKAFKRAGLISEISDDRPGSQ